MWCCRHGSACRRQRNTRITAGIYARQPLPQLEAAELGGRSAQRAGARLELTQAGGTATFKLCVMAHGNHGAPALNFRIDGRRTIGWSMYEIPGLPTPPGGMGVSRGRAVRFGAHFVHIDFLFVNSKYVLRA